MWKIPVWRCFAFRPQIKYYFWKWDWDKEIIIGNIFTQVVIITFGTILPNVIYLLGIGKIYNIRQDLAKSCRMLYIFNYGKIRDVDWRAYYSMRDGDHAPSDLRPWYVTVSKGPSPAPQHKNTKNTKIINLLYKFFSVRYFFKTVLKHTFLC